MLLWSMLNIWKMFALCPSRHCISCFCILTFLCLPIEIVICHETTLKAIVEGDRDDIGSRTTNTNDVEVVEATTQVNRNDIAIDDSILIAPNTSDKADNVTQAFMWTNRCDPKTEVFTECSNSCPADCENPERVPCKKHCWSGCECAPGYVMNHNWKCIPKENCPKCAENEHYRNCGNECQPTCSTYQNMAANCHKPYGCKQGCYCNYGFVRDKTNGTCIPVEQCPHKCPINEYWDMNGPPCIRSAQDPRPKCLFEKREAACVCNTGFKRHPISKQCVPISTKDFQTCQQNETYSQCGSDCNTQCNHEIYQIDLPDRKRCPTVCNRGCFCNQGYRRHVHSGRCVLPNDCAALNEQIQSFNSFLEFA